MEPTQIVILKPAAKLPALDGGRPARTLRADDRARRTKEVLVAEPVHSTGYLPLYIAMAKGYFADVTVKLVTIETGSGHTNAVLSGQAFAFIGGPEHNAFAKAKGAELRAVVNCVDRGNVYFCAAHGYEPTDSDWPAYFKGKTIAVGPFGGTPNSITRYLLGKWKLDAKQGREADRDRQFGDHRGGARQTGSDRRGDRALHHPGRPQQDLGRAVLQRAEGARSLRLFDLQRAARDHPQGAGAGPRLRARHGARP